jgi:ribosomal protein S18 acetylase RimI-like enzyme
MEGIYVSPEHRGRGLGKQLWQACIKVNYFYSIAVVYSIVLISKFEKSM